MFLFTEVFANGGIQRFNQTILDACDRLGIGGTVLSLQDSSASIARSRQQTRMLIIGFSGDRRQFALAATRMLLVERFDHVLIGHINLLSMTAAVLALRPTRLGSTMLIAHGIEVWTGIGKIRRLALARMDRILCVSRYTRQRILEQAPALLPGRLPIFPNALAQSWASPFPATLNRQLPPRFLLSVTRLEPGDRYKGIATVIEAFSMLEDESMHYYVIGHGRDLAFLELVAQRCGVGDRVHFLRGISDSELIALYQNCLAFVLPSGKEGFGIVFLEAMFFGAPVIAAGEKGAMDVIENGVTGISVRFGDAIGIKAAIERLASDGALRDRLRSNARSLVTEDGPFTFASFTRRCAEVFDPAETIAARRIAQTG
ncbi:MAG: glycosyltransferase family 4 protein [Steroidobacteraceae bacterium]